VGRRSRRAETPNSRPTLGLSPRLPFPARHAPSPERGTPDAERSSSRGRVAAALLVVAAGSALVAALSCAPRSTRPRNTTLGGCVICHVDIADALARTKHERASIGCVTCHGLSKGHVKDENNEVKPDRVFPRHEIDPWCDGCHFTTCSHAEADKPLPKGARRRTCVDCHGAHNARIPPATPRPGPGAPSPTHRTAARLDEACPACVLPGEHAGGT